MWHVPQVAMAQLRPWPTFEQINGLLVRLLPQHLCCLLTAAPETAILFFVAPNDGLADASFLTRFIFFSGGAATTSKSESSLIPLSSSSSEISVIVAFLAVARFPAISFFGAPSAISYEDRQFLLAVLSAKRTLASSAIKVAFPG